MEVCYLDFRKAFDSVNHRFLLSKWEAHGVVGKVLKWIAGFLTGRHLFVSVEGKRSLMGTVPSGVPQGSVLGPLLFLVFINDLPSKLDNPCYLFADDLKLVGKQGGDELQADLDTVYEWTARWDLPLNQGKCQHLSTDRTDTQTLAIGANDDRSLIPRVNAIRDLGVRVTADFKQGEQCKLAAQKAQRALHQLRKAVTSRNPSVMVPLYKTYVRPHLEYCVQAWSPHFKKDCKILEGVQRRFTKGLLGLREVPYEQRLPRLSLFSLERRRRRGDLIEVFKLLTGSSNAGNPSLFTLRAGDQLRGHPLTLSKRRVRRAQVANFFTHRVVNNWNALPEDVVLAKSTSEFKMKLDAAWETVFPNIA